MNKFRMQIYILRNTVHGNFIFKEVELWAEGHFEGRALVPKRICDSIKQNKFQNRL